MYSIILTYCMVQSASWAANWFAASQEFPRISRNLKVHYRTHKRPPPISILGQPNPVHIPTSHLLKTHLILSTHLHLGLSSSLFPSGFPTKTPYAPLFSPTFYLRIVLSPEQASRMYVFLNISVLQGGVVSTSPNPQAGGPLLVGCPLLFIQFIRSYPPYRRPFLCPQPEDAPCRGDRDPLHGVQ